MTRKILGELIVQVKRPEKLLPLKRYKVLGVAWYCKGAWIKYEKTGSEIKAKELTKVKSGDLIYSRLFAWKGSFAIIPDNLNECYVSNEFPIFKAKSSNVLLEYIYLFLKTPKLWRYIERQSTGLTSISRNRFKEDKFLNLSIDYVDLDKQKKKIRQNAVLERLVSDIRLRITASSDCIHKIRKMILKKAIEGQLVPQRGTEESAINLLTRAKREKEQLIKGKKVRVKRPEPQLVSKLSLPSGWVLTSLSELGLVNPRNALNDNLEVSFIPMALIPEGFNGSAKHEIRKWREVKGGFTHLASNDVVMAKITPCFQNRKSVVLKELKNNFGAGTTELHVFRPVANTVIPEYILFFLKSEDFIDCGISKMTGSAGQKRIPSSYFSNSPIALPPYEEQKRIVLKVNVLMNYCDELEKKMMHVYGNVKKLAEAFSE